MQNPHGMYEYYENNDEEQEGADPQTNLERRYETLLTEMETLNEYHSLQQRQNSGRQYAHGARETDDKKSEQISNELRKIKTCHVILVVLTVIVVVTSVTAIVLSSIVTAERNEVKLLKEQLTSLQQQLTNSVKMASDRITNLQDLVNVLTSDHFPPIVYANCYQDISSCTTTLSNGSNLLSCKTIPSLNITEPVSINDAL